MGAGASGQISSASEADFTAAIAALTAEAKAKLGAKFDPRGFHATVLDTGALPMPVLEQKVADWIAAQQ